MYTRGFDITASKVTLDCRGAVIDATGRGGGSGIEVRAPADADLSRVTIRNCVVRGFLNSIRVTREGFRALPAGHEYDHGIRDVLHRAHRGVGLQGSRHLRGRLRDAHHHPPLHDHRGAGAAASTSRPARRTTSWSGNSIRDNGFRENGPGGSIFSFAGARFRFWGIGREGISIDGSRRNLVAGNSFEGNSAGGIFLYTNCGEYVNSRPERWFQRRYGADDNMIVANRFEGGVNGVWVGSRMGESTLPMECSDPTYVKQGITWIALDRAARNRILANSFRDVTYGVRVEDDHTKVMANQFSGPDATHHAVVIGTPWRTSVLGKPVRGTALIANTSAIVANPNPYRWVEGQAATTVALNRALGRRVGICQGKTLPRGPFVMTIAFAGEPAGGPEVPAPDPLSAPTVGALAPC